MTRRIVRPEKAEIKPAALDLKLLAAVDAALAAADPGRLGRALAKLTATKNPAYADGICERLAQADGNPYLVDGFFMPVWALAGWDALARLAPFVAATRAADQELARAVAREPRRAVDALGGILALGPGPAALRGVLRLAALAGPEVAQPLCGEALRLTEGCSDVAVLEDLVELLAGVAASNAQARTRLETLAARPDLAARAGTALLAAASASGGAPGTAPASRGAGGDAPGTAPAPGGARVDILAKMLRQLTAATTWEKRRALVWALAEHGSDEGVHAALVRLASADESPYVRGAAVGALQLGDAAATAAIRGALADAADSVRWLAAVGAGRCGATELRADLEALCFDRAAQCRTNAGKALATLGLPLPAAPRPAAEFVAGFVDGGEDPVAGRTVRISVVLAEPVAMRGGGQTALAREARLAGKVAQAVSAGEVVALLEVQDDQTHFVGGKDVRPDLSGLRGIWRASLRRAGTPAHGAWVLWRAERQAAETSSST